MLPQDIPPASDRSQDDSEPTGRRAERKKAAHALVHEMLAQGHSRRAIARHLGWSLNTVLRYAKAARWQDTIRENQPQPSRLDPLQALPGKTIRRGMQQRCPAARRTGRRARSCHLRHGPRLHRHLARGSVLAHHSSVAVPS
ncbi:helix-turn-helix domain-containing protein [Streptomyces sp. NPDC001279]|uniref:helix-turn-helix domain-containing protein n=1 Tax=Streptomyces sp. NPDC001279 TaxID=3364556 RepID=UPI00368C3F03